MWEKADQWIKQAPEVGHGYRSFWIGDSADSLGLLHAFGLTDGRVFQFHNNFREILVDTGWVGLIAFLLSGGMFLFYVIANTFLSPGATSAFIASTYLVLIPRCFIETIILPFSSYTSLLYACGAASIVFFMNRVLHATHGPVSDWTAPKARVLDRPTGFALLRRRLKGNSRRRPSPGASASNSGQPV
jgi:O-antigen ligase